MKILLVGGTGIISSGVMAECVSRGYETYVLNRGNHLDRLLPGVNSIKADYSNEDETKKALKNHEFDSAIDFRTFVPDEIKKAIRVFTGVAKQYIFISSGTVYKKPLKQFIITEDAPKGNYHNLYARNKFACECELLRAVDKGFPGVIVRPSLTYSDFNILVSLNSNTAPYSFIDRMRRGKPIIVHGDGTSLWTITHNSDFARGIVGLCGNEKAIGEAFHITSDEVLDWNTIYTTVAHAAGVEANLIHIASDFLVERDERLRGSLLGDHGCSAVFDNSKIKKFVPDFKCLVPFEEGAKRAVNWFDADPKNRETVDLEWDKKMDDIIAYYKRP